MEAVAVLRPIGELLMHVTIEEFVMLLVTIVPLYMGLVSASHVFTGRVYDDDDDGKEEPKEEVKGMSSVSADVEAAISGVNTTATRIEQQMTSLQRTHDAQFADVHKDLAGIVWELSKLRADMARWQVSCTPGAHRVPTVRSVCDPLSFCRHWRNSSRAAPFGLQTPICRRPEGNRHQRSRQPNPKPNGLLSQAEHGAPLQTTTLDVRLVPRLCM